MSREEMAVSDKIAPPGVPICRGLLGGLGSGLWSDGAPGSTAGPGGIRVDIFRTDGAPYLKTVKFF